MIASPIVFFAMNSRGGHNHGGPRHHSYTQGPPSPSSEFPPLSGQVHPKPHNKWPQKGGYIQQKGNHEHPGVGASSSTQGHHSSPSDLATNMSEMSIGGSKAREVGPGGAAILPTPPPGVQEVIPPTTQMQQVGHEFVAICFIVFFLKFLLFLRIFSFIMFSLPDSSSAHPTTVHRDACTGNAYEPSLRLPFRHALLRSSPAGWRLYYS